MEIPRKLWCCSSIFLEKLTLFFFAWSKVARSSWRITIQNGPIGFHQNLHAYNLLAYLNGV